MDERARHDGGSVLFAGLLIATLGQALAAELVAGSNIYSAILCIISLFGGAGLSFAYLVHLWRSRLTRA